MMMLDRYAIFAAKAPLLMDILLKEFDCWQPIHAAAVAGNGGHESRGFTAMREEGQPPGRGGYSWFQWTGPRAHSRDFTEPGFLEWCTRNHLDWKSDAAATGYLIFELKGAYKRVVASVAKTTILKAATIAFERGYEAAGVIAMADRVEWADRALSAWKATKGPEHEAISA